MNNIHYGIDEVLKKSSKKQEADLFYQIMEDYLATILKKQYGEYIFLDRERLKVVEDRLNDVEKRLDKIESSNQDVIIVEEMDMEIAKQKVLDYTKKHRIFDIVELHQNIGCELDLLIKILDELKKEGRIEGE